MDETSILSEELSASEKGTSNATLAALVIVILLVTIIGTWAVLSNISSEKPQALNTEKQSVDSGRVGVTITPSPFPEGSQTTGLVTLTIK